MLLAALPFVVAGCASALSPGEQTAQVSALEENAVVDADGFFAPTEAVIDVPEGLGRPPTSADVQVRRGFDGKTVDEATALMRANLTTPLYPANEGFVAETLRATYRAVTLGTGNFLVPDAPPARFLQTLEPGARVTLLGTMSALQPAILEVEDSAGKSYFKRGSNGYEAVEAALITNTGALFYPVVMRSEIRLQPQGVRTTYPAWSAKALSGPTMTVVEGE
jgi:hypothetical protein